MSEISDAHNFVRQIRRDFRSSFTRAALKRLTDPTYAYCLGLIEEERLRRIRGERGEKDPYNP